VKAIRIKPDEHDNWYRLAPLLVRSGENAAYDKHRSAMLQRFADTTNAPLAERTAKACLLVPVEGRELIVASLLAERAITLGSNDGWVAYSQFASCLAEYRTGKFTNAVELGRKALVRPADDNARDAQAYSVLAMALYKQKRFDEARAALASAVDIAKTKLPSLDSPDLGEGWLDVLIADILMREAKGVIGSAPVPGPQSK
jgi:tetratricopeptide (TPR) repeat protein